ncbi:hypothetical protein RB195_004807 [Necator americanus]|uniref:Uncharacterized protein n=1 Tax=Necator americanus TaxID=51031 RepID=A0ABR1BJR4_NECAM
MRVRVRDALRKHIYVPDRQHEKLSVWWRHDDAVRRTNESARLACVLVVLDGRGRPPPPPPQPLRMRRVVE